jgi:hypothetical protein
MIRFRLVQELRHGLIWRLAEEANPGQGDLVPSG